MLKYIKKLLPKFILRYIEVTLGLRCNGDCCKYFYLPYSPDELKQWAIEEKASDKPLFNNNPTEMQQVSSMVTLVESKLNQAGIKSYYYKCNNLNSKGDCSIYSTRPVLCSGYPFYGKEYGMCNYKGCTWDKAGGNSTLRKTVNGCKKLLKKV